MWWSALARWAERQPWPDLSTAWSVQPWRDWGRHLQTMGVLRHGQGDDDWGLWAAPLTQDGGLSMGTLSRLVEAWSFQGPAAGLGWALHRWALGDWVLRQASAWPHDDAMPVYAGAGTWGWCPEALVPWWRGQALGEAQSEALSDWSRVASTGSMLLLPGHWTHLVRAVWRGRAPADASMGGWQWQVLAREQAEPHAAEQVGPDLHAVVAPFIALGADADQRHRVREERQLDLGGPLRARGSAFGHVVTRSVTRPGGSVTGIASRRAISGVGRLHY